MSEQGHRDLTKQGAHPDPLDPALPRPDPAAWTPRQRDAYEGPAMRTYRSALLRDGIADVRGAVVDDLSVYHKLPPEDCLERCVNWEAWSVAEWQARRRDTSEALAEFYHSVESWAFDLLWYAYLQAEGYAYPVSAAIAGSLGRAGGGRRHLDFGSGVGVTGQMFRRLGYETDLADVSTTLLAFARFRLERRGEAAGYIDLNVAEPAPDSYDVITDLGATARMLHRALRPGGVLFANFDVRPRTPENAWHLYDDDLPLRWTLQRSGFEPEESLDGMITRYRRVEPAGWGHRARGVRDAVLLRSPLRPVYRTCRAAVSRTLARAQAEGA
jgi:SAM-dependent methyltransferase